MHRSMLYSLRARFAHVPVTNDPEGSTTFGEILRGWDSDQAVINAFKKYKLDWQHFEKSLPAVNNFAAFKTEDDFCRFIQTTLRLSKLDPKNPGKLL